VGADLTVHHLRHHPPGLDLGIIEEPIDGVDRSAGDAGSLKEGQPFVRGPGPKSVRERGPQGLVVLGPVRIVSEPLVVDHVVQFEGRTQLGPQGVVADGDDDVPVLRLEELEGLESTGQINSYSKKMESQLRREKTKILRNLEGIRNMTKLPGAMVIVDVNREVNAVREARKLGIPTICLIDTDSDPDFADIPIPGNDEAMRAIEVVVSSLCAAVMEGKTSRAVAAEGVDAGGNDSEPQRRRSNRARFRADEAPAAPSDDEATPDAVSASANPAGGPDAQS